MKYSGGFIGWVVDIDYKGLPSQVLVVKNTSYPESNLNILVANSDIVQLGKLIGNVSHVEFGIKINTYHGN